MVCGIDGRNIYEIRLDLATPKGAASRYRAVDLGMAVEEVIHDLTLPDGKQMFVKGSTAYECAILYLDRVQHMGWLHRANLAALGIDIFKERVCEEIPEVCAEFLEMGLFQLQGDLVIPDKILEMMKIQGSDRVFYDQVNIGMTRNGEHIGMIERLTMDGRRYI
jgi:hypothetical protein